MYFTTRVSIEFVVCALSLTLTAAAATAQTKAVPTSTPTPRPGTLAAYASRISLDPRVADPVTGRVVITTEDLAELASDGAVTFGEYAAGRQPSVKPVAGNEADERGAWRARYLNQREVVTEIEARRSAVEADIEAINRERVTPRSLARLDRAQTKLRLIEQEIRRARAELARIVREARRRGAQPGWFR